MIATFNRFEIEMTKEEALSASHPGPCDMDVAALLSLPELKQQLAKIPDEMLASELKEYGTWSDVELQDRRANESRIIWIAAGDIADNYFDVD